jgi:prevent-host-death family protein
MHVAGIKELKNRLTHYIKLIKQGDHVIVTDRGTPVAIMHGLDHIEDSAGVDERLAALANRRMVRFPRRREKLVPFAGVKVTGMPASETIIEDRG